MKHPATRWALIILLVIFAGIAAGTALAQDAPLIVVDSVVWGHDGLDDESLTCAQTSRFKHEEQIVWRVKVVDPLTGVELTDADLASVEVVLVDGQVFEAEFGGHPPREPVDEYWTTNWVIPADYPSGLLDYTVEAVANDGRTGELIVFPLESSMLTILPE